MPGEIGTAERKSSRTDFTHLLLKVTHGVPKVFRKGEMLFMEGGEPKWLFLIHHGKVVLSKLLPNGSKTIVSVRVAGDIVGEVAVLGGEPYDTDAVALTDVHTFLIQRGAFLYALRTNWALAEKIIADLTSRLRQSQEAICLLSTQRVEKRLAALLLMLIGKFGTRTDEGIVLDSSFSRYDLAAMAGTTVETTVRTLSAWAHAGIIKKYRRQIVIIDAKRLAQIAREP